MSAAAPQAYAKPLPKPSSVLLRRPLQTAFKRNIIIALGISAVFGLGYKLLVSDPRKRAYKHFYQTWDNDRHYKRMVEAGVFQYAKPEKQYPEWINDYEKEVDKAIANLKK